MTVKNWWDAIFHGHLKIGVDEKKLQLLENEAFLYFNASACEQVNLT